MEETKGFEPVVVPNDFYNAKVVGEKQIDTKYGASIVLTFEILDGPHKGKRIDGLATFKLNKKTKLYSWLKKLGIDVDKIEIGKTENVEVIGRECRILTTTTEREGLDGKKFLQSSVKDIEKKA